MDVEQRARDALNDAFATYGRRPFWDDTYLRPENPTLEAVCRLIEQHDAKMREVSDAVKGYLDADYRRQQGPLADTLSRLIRPDPVASITDELDHILATGTADQMADWLGENAPAIREALTITKEPS